MSVFLFVSLYMGFGLAFSSVCMFVLVSLLLLMMLFAAAPPPLPLLPSSDDRLGGSLA